jgi:hypothetical protein
MRIVKVALLASMFANTGHGYGLSMPPIALKALASSLSIPPISTGTLKKHPNAGQLGYSCAARK